MGRFLLGYCTGIGRCCSTGSGSRGSFPGFNTKAKLAARKSFGFRTYRDAEIALYHALGALPEPEFTHRFC